MAMIGNSLFNPCINTFTTTKFSKSVSLFFISK
jgi:hypothetical protein